MEEQKETEITSDGVTDSDVEKEKPVPESGESEVTEEKVSNSEVVTHSSNENGDESPAEMVNISEAERNNESSEDFEFANGINGSDEESWETVSGIKSKFLREPSVAYISTLKKKKKVAHISTLQS